MAYEYLIMSSACARPLRPVVPRPSSRTNLSRTAVGMQTAPSASAPNPRLGLRAERHNGNTVALSLDETTALSVTCDTIQKFDTESSRLLRTQTIARLGWSKLSRTSCRGHVVTERSKYTHLRSKG